MSGEGLRHLAARLRRRLAPAAERRARADAELQEFLAGDGTGPPPAPAFRERLRATLWARLARDAGRAPGEPPR